MSVDAFSDGSQQSFVVNMITSPVGGLLSSAERSEAAVHGSIELRVEPGIGGSGAHGRGLLGSGWCQNELLVMNEDHSYLACMASVMNLS